MPIHHARDSQVSSATNVLSTPQLRWDGEAPYNLTYGDIYHHVNGMDEVRRVFLAPSKLTIRSQGTASDNLVVGELGFGTGLNLAVLAADISGHLDRTNSQLHYISFEQHPFTPDDFRRLADGRKTLLPLYAELAQSYPPPIPGWHRRYLAGGRIMLSLYFGDAAVGLADIQGRQQQPVNAWLLDGFAPDRNPTMWTTDIYRQVRALSCAGSTVASFTAAGAVRRGLQEAGFQMRRVTQMPHKLHSLAGVVETAAPGDLQAQQPPQQVQVIGGGIAGASIARHLAWHQIDAEVLEAGAQAGGASRLPATLLHARLLGETGAAAALRANGANYAHTLCAVFQGYDACGVLQVAQTAAQQERLTQVAGANRWHLHPRISPADWLQLVDAPRCAQLASCDAAQGLFFPNAGIVSTPRLVAALMQHPKILRRQFQPALLHRWHTKPPSRASILACGLGVRDLAAARYLELAPVAGQLDLVTLAAPPTRPLAGALYQIPDPSNPQRTWVGSTYEHGPWAPAAATAKNLQGLASASRQAPLWHARARAIRCVTSDRWPVAGRIANELPVWVSAGHGSMGMVTAHQSAAIVVSELTGHFAPVTTEQQALLRPQRFLSRQARRGYRMGAQPAPRW